MMLEQKTIIGIDIGCYLIKMIKVGKKDIGNEWAVRSIPKGLIIDDKIISEDVLAQQIKVMMKESRIRGKKCSLCLPSMHVITKAIILPVMDKEVLKENIYYDMEGYLPLDLDRYIIDFKILKTSMINGIEYWDILVIAVLEEIVLSYIRVLEKNGLKPLYVDVPFNCLHKLLISHSPLEQQSNLVSGNYCIIDVGYHSINIILINKGIYFVDKTIFFENFHIGQVIDEVMAVIRYFKKNTPVNNRLDNIILFGGGAMDHNLSDELAKETGVKVTLYSDWIDSNNIYYNGLGKEELMLLGNAIGSTIRRTSS